MVAMFFLDARLSPISGGSETDRLGHRRRPMSREHPYKRPDGPLNEVGVSHERENFPRIQPDLYGKKSRRLSTWRRLV